MVFGRRPLRQVQPLVCRRRQRRSRRACLQRGHAARVAVVHGTAAGGGAGGRGEGEVNVRGGEREKTRRELVQLYFA